MAGGLSGSSGGIACKDFLVLIVFESALQLGDASESAELKLSNGVNSLSL